MCPIARTAAVALTSAACCCAVWADDATSHNGPALSVDVNGVMVDVTPPRTAREASPGPSQYLAGTRTMLWSRNGAMQFGVGVEQAGWQPASVATAAAVPTAATGRVQPARVVLGASVDTTATTQLRWQTPLPASPAHDATQAQVMEFALVLKPRDSLAALRRGTLMKLELSGQTQLALRPRGGGRMALTLTSKW